MCTVSIDIDEAVIRDLRPELDTPAAIRLWAQELVDSRLQQLQLEDEETIDVEEVARNREKGIRSTINYMANTDKWYFAYTFDGETVTIVDACHAQNMHEKESRTPPQNP